MARGSRRAATERECAVCLWGLGYRVRRVREPLSTRPVGRGTRLFAVAVICGVLGLIVG